MNGAAAPAITDRTFKQELEGELLDHQAREHELLNILAEVVEAAASGQDAARLIAQIAGLRQSKSERDDESDLWRAARVVPCTHDRYQNGLVLEDAMVGSRAPHAGKPSPALSRRTHRR